MGARQGLVKIAGWVISAAGAFTSVGGDVGAALRGIVPVIAGNLLGFGMFLIGLVVLAYAYRDELRRLLGLSWSNAQWMREITRWTHEKRKWKLDESDQDGRSFRIVFEVPASEKTARKVTVSKPAGNDVVIVAMRINVADEHRKQLGTLSKDEVAYLNEELILALSARSLDVEMKVEGGLPATIGILTGFPSNPPISEQIFFEKVQSVVGAADTVVVLVGRFVRRAKPAAR